jgi:hypothetical protein
MSARQAGMCVEGQLKHLFQEVLQASVALHAFST